MKKSLSIIALFAIFLLSVSAHTRKIFEASVGYSAPLFTISTADSTLSLDSTSGRFTLLSFWNSTAPESRMAVNRYNAFVSRVGEDKMNLIAINLDTNDRLFSQICKADGLVNGKHLNLSESERTSISSLYHLNEGLNSFLINPAGKIVAVNPDCKTLESVFADE